MARHYSCPSWGTINSTCGMSCWKCGGATGSAYQKQHKEGIIKQMANKK
ncbi:MAG: hypothetical protein KBA08_05300 [Firmicutes bacterium]|nr:hypothetical protein [Bacillota bacterium]